jgi:hypothetical protein
MDLERDLLSLMSAIDKLLERKVTAPVLKNLDYGYRESAALSTCHPSIHKSWHQLRRQAAVAQSV